MNGAERTEDVETEGKANVDERKAALAGDDADAVKAAQEKLTTSAQKQGEAIYANQPAEGEEPAAPEAEEDVVDAEVVEDDETETPAAKDAPEDDAPDENTKDKK